MNLFLVRRVMNEYNCTFSHAVYFIEQSKADKIDKVREYLKNKKNNDLLDKATTIRKKMK